MVQRITQIIKDYQSRVRETPCVPETSFRIDSLGFPGVANKLFLTFLFSEHAIGVQFLKDVGLIRSKMQCNSATAQYTHCMFSLTDTCVAAAHASGFTYNIFRLP